MAPSRTNQNLYTPKIAAPRKDLNITAIPREVLSLFQGFEKLDEENWITWKGHLQDNLEICNLWDIVCGDEEIPSDSYPNDRQAWISRERIARVLIKNSLGPKDYQQVRHATTACDIWETLSNLHQPMGALGKVDLIWKFWSKRCVEGSSVREHIGDILGTHAELAEAGIHIENYLLAVMMSKSLPPSYDNCVSTIFAGIRDLELADPKYVANKIFEEEMRRGSKSEDLHLATQNRCQNCNRKGHLFDDCYAKGGGKEGQPPWQIAKRKKEEAKKNIFKIQGKMWK